MSDRPSGLDERQTLQIIMGVAGALAFVHKQGVLHLDVHGGNIFLTSCGDNTVACLADFGMAYVSEDETGVPGFRVHPDVNRAPELFFAPGASLKRNGGPVKYTLQYVPPRAIEKKLYAPALDVWALGCVMHFADHGQYLSVPRLGEGEFRRVWNTTPLT